MKTYIYLANEDGTKGGHLATVNLEVVPGGTYVIDDIPYTLVGKPTFFIEKKLNEYGLTGPAQHTLQAVELLVSKLP